MGTTLAELGWDEWFEERFSEHRGRGLEPARVAMETGPDFEVWAETGPLSAHTSGKMRHEAASRGELPAVGDWVAVQAVPGERKAVIHAVLPRKTSFSRKEAGGRDRRTGGRTEEQVLASNIDVAFIVCALEGYRNLNLRKVERYLAVCRASGAAPAVLLNKADLDPEYPARVGEVRAVAPEAPVLAVSAVTGFGVEGVCGLLAGGRTAVLLGPSGVGKSALTNALLGNESAETGAVRDSDGKGRHTTSRRQMFILPGGGLVIDTPGIRELAMWAVGDGWGTEFEDVTALFTDCRFKDCRHENEPGCAVKRALEDGTLDRGRWDNYLHLQKEEAFVRRRHDLKARLEEKKKWKGIAKEIKRIYKDREKP